MSIELGYRQEGPVLCVQMGGEWKSRTMHEAIGAARVEADKRKVTRLLIDARALSLPPDEVTRFFAGIHWAALFDQTFRAAFVVQPVLYNGFAELVARNRGANVSAFFDEAPARAWLEA
jgi:hypothetical protein